MQLWRGWLLYLGLLAAYAAVFLTWLSAATSRAGGAGSAGRHCLCAEQVLPRSLSLPGLLGGPWHWYHPANYFSAFADPPADLEWLAVLVVLGLVAASIVVRRRAWRAWLILVVWLVVADTVPVLIGRLKFPAYAGLHGLQTRYVADVQAMLAIVVALVYWPVADPRPDPNRRPGGAATSSPDGGG